MCLSRYEVSGDIHKSLQLCKLIKSKAAGLATTDIRFFELYNKCLLFEAPHLFDSYLLYLEKDRDYKNRFYLPKYRHLNKHGLIQALQDLEDDKLDLLSISMPSGTQKTTLEKFFASWIIGRHPEDYSLFFSHSGDITRMFYEGVLDITTSNEYRWGDIFPHVKLSSTDAKRECINFDKYKPFANLQCTSVGSKNAGKVRCNRYLYCDDLIGGIEEALNKNMLDKLWRIYGTDARQRKLNEQVKEIHIATRWSVHDVIGRLQRAYEGNSRARFITIPDIDPITGKSNFDYEFNGMSVDFFKDQELLMDEISYKCLYKNEPIEREGLLYINDDLRRYLELPLHEPDAILAICDTKDKGTDYLFLPVLYQYGEDFYCVDCVFDDNADYGIQYKNCADIIINHKMQQCQFESNNGGSRVAYEVEKLVRQKGGRCNITSKVTTSNKETKIIVNADWVKKHVLFKDKSLYTHKDSYGKMLSFLLSYSVKGKNPHDDVPDGFAQLALFVTSMYGVKVTVMDRSKLGI
jgi:predicted phage terminase large subunit-like protein